MGYSLVLTVREDSSTNTGNSGDSGACVGQGGPWMGPPDPRPPLLLPPVSRTSQWSEEDELVEPAGGEESGFDLFAHLLGDVHDCLMTHFRQSCKETFTISDVILLKYIVSSSFPSIYEAPLSTDTMIMNAPLSGFAWNHKEPPFTG